MKIAVIGLGLIGGSLCKTIKKYTNHECFGYDTNEKVLAEALSQSAIDDVCVDFSAADLTIVCLYPQATIDFILKNAKNFKKDSLVIDTCGIKSAIIQAVEQPLSTNSVEFIGCHPMAGREFSGFEFSLDSLFDNASFIAAPTEKVSAEKILLLEKFVEELHFKKFVKTTAKRHDEIIAYTSQLAHIVSSAYIKSPSHALQDGFSAGSFKDLTRVAKLNEDMWTGLFLMNSEPLIFEIDQIISHLTEYKSALEGEKADELHKLLRDGRILKEQTP